MDDLHSRTRRSYALAQETPVLKDVLPPPRVQGRGVSYSPLRQPSTPSGPQSQFHGRRDFYSPPRGSAPSQYGGGQTQNRPSVRHAIPQPHDRHFQVFAPARPQSRIGGFSPHRQTSPPTTGTLGRLIESKEEKDDKNIATVHPSRTLGRGTSPSRIPLSKASLKSNVDQNLPETSAYNRPTPSSGISSVSTFKRQKLAESPSKSPSTDAPPQSQSFHPSSVAKIVQLRGVSPSRIPIKGLPTSTAAQPQTSRSHTPDGSYGSQRGRFKVSPSTDPAKRAVPRGVSPSRIPRSTSKKDLREEKPDVTSRSLDYFGSQGIPSTDTSLTQTSPEELKQKNASLSRGTSPSRIPTSIRRKKQQAAAAKSPDAASSEVELRLTRRQSVSPGPSPDRAIHRSRKSEFVKPSAPSPKNVVEASNKEAKDEGRHSDRVPRGISPSRIPIKRQMKDSDALQISPPKHQLSPIKVAPPSTSPKIFQTQRHFSPKYHETDIDSTIPTSVPKVRDEMAEIPLKGFPVPIPRELSYVSSGSESSLGILDLPRQDSSTSLISFKHPFEQTHGPDPPASQNQKKLSSSSPVHPRSPALPYPRTNLSVYNPSAPKVPETKKIRPYSPKKSTNILHCQINAESLKPVDSSADNRQRRMYKSMESLNNMKRSPEPNALKMPPRTLTSISLSGLRHAQNMMEFEVPTAEAVNDYPPPYTPPSPPETPSYASLENSRSNTPSKHDKQFQLKEIPLSSHEVDSSVKPHGAPSYNNYLNSDAQLSRNFGQQNLRTAKSTDNLNGTLNAPQPADNKYGLSAGKKYPSSVDDLLDFGNEAADTTFAESYKQNLRLADSLMNTKNQQRNGLKFGGMSPINRLQDKRSLSQNDFYFPVKSVQETMDRKDLARSDAEAVKALILGQKSRVPNDWDENSRSTSGQAMPNLPDENKVRQPEQYRNITANPTSQYLPGSLSGCAKLSTSQPHLYYDKNRKLREEWLKQADQKQRQNKEISELSSRRPWGTSPSLEQIHRQPPQYKLSPRPDGPQGHSRLHSAERRENDDQEKQPLLKGLLNSTGQIQRPQGYSQSADRLGKILRDSTQQQKPEQLEGQQLLPQMQPHSGEKYPVHSLNKEQQPMPLQEKHRFHTPHQGQNRPLLYDQQSERSPSFEERNQIPSTDQKPPRQTPTPQPRQSQRPEADSQQQRDLFAHPLHSSSFNLSDADQVAIVDLQCSSNSSPNIDYRLSGKLAFIRSNSGSDIKSRDLENPEEPTSRYKSTAYRQGEAQADSVPLVGRDAAHLNISTPTAAAAAQDKAPCVLQPLKVCSQNVPLNGRVDIPNGVDKQQFPLLPLSSKSTSLGVINSAYESDECNETEDGAKVSDGLIDDADKDNILLLSQLKSLENDQCQKLGIENKNFNYVSERKFSDNIINNSLSSEPRGLSSKLVSDYSSHETLDSIHYIANQLSPGVKFVSPQKLPANKRVNGRQRTKHREEDPNGSTSSDSEGGFTNARDVPASLIQPKNNAESKIKYSNLEDLKRHRRDRNRTVRGKMEGGNEAENFDPAPKSVDSDPNAGITNASFHDEGFVSPSEDYLATTGIENFENLKPNENSGEKLSQLHSKTYSPAKSKNPTPHEVDESQDLSRMRLNFLKSSKPSAKPSTQRDSKVQSYNGRPVIQNEPLLAKRSKSHKDSGKKTKEVQRQPTQPVVTNLENGVENGSTGRKRKPNALGSFGFRSKKPPSVSTDVENQGSSEDRLSRTSRTSRTSSGPIITKTYWLRFYILAIFSLVAMVQCIVWGTWGPITESAITALDWSEATISLLNGWGPITIIVFIVPVAWFNQRYGLRVGVTLAASLVLAGALLRCIPVQGTAFTVLANMCAISTGISGCLTLSLPAMVAATWFPPRERTTATAVAALFSQLGSALIYLEPLIVRTSDIAGDDSKMCEGTSVANLRHRRSKREAIRLPDAVHRISSRVIRQTHTTSDWSSPPGGRFNSDISHVPAQEDQTTQSSGISSSGIYGRPPNRPYDHSIPGGQGFTSSRFKFNPRPSFRQSNDVVHDVRNSGNLDSINPNVSGNPGTQIDPNAQTDSATFGNSTVPSYPNLSRGQPNRRPQSEISYLTASQNLDNSTLFDDPADPLAALNSTNSENLKSETYPHSLDNGMASRNYFEQPFSRTQGGSRTSSRNNGPSNDLDDTTYMGSYSNDYPPGHKGETEPMSDNKTNVDDEVTTSGHLGVGATDEARDAGNSRSRSNFHGLEPESRIISYESKVTPKDIEEDIMDLMYIQAGMAGLLFLFVVVYFPAAPPYPPSPSSATERLNYFAGIKTMLKSPQMVLLVVTYAFSVGIPIVWVALMNFSLCCIGIGQDESKNVAMAAILTSCGTAFIAARITDLIFGYLKRTIIVLLTLASFCFLWFLLISTAAINASIVQVYLSVTGGVALQYATVPLLTELAVEIAYPCPESVVGVMIIGSFNIVAAAFLLLLMIPSNCYIWVNGVLVACTSFTIIPFLFVKEIHGRRATDMAGAQAETVQGHDNVLEELPTPKTPAASPEYTTDTATGDDSRGDGDSRSLDLADLAPSSHHTEL